MSENLRNRTLDALVERHPEVKAARQHLQSMSVEAAAPLDRQGLGAAQKRLSEAIRDTTSAILRAADVVVGSCIAAGNEALDAAFMDSNFERYGGQPLRFSCVIIDESSQATEPSLLVPLTRGASQLILVGDQQQLPPTVLSPTASAGGLAHTPLIRLLQAGITPLTLTTQYRMDPVIAAFPNEYFYGKTSPHKSLAE